MSDSGNLTQTPGLSSTVTGELTVAAVILIFILFAVTLILYLRAKGYSGTIGMSRAGARRPVSVSAQPNLVKQALDPSILNSIPVTVFRAEDFQEEGGLECSVCLSELKDGDKARLLPKCRHGFHVECIDMWFQSNSTCPLCRDPVQCLGTSDEGSSSPEVLSNGKRQRAMLTIDIPRRGALLEGIASPPIRPAEGIRSPALETLRNLGRILSKGGLNNNCVGSSCSSPRSRDIEQGAHSAVIIQKSSESASYS